MKVKIEFENFDRKLLVDTIKVITNEQVKIQLTDNSNIVYTIVDINPEEILNIQEKAEQTIKKSKNNAKITFTVISK